MTAAARRCCSTPICRKLADAGPVAAIAASSAVLAGTREQASFRLLSPRTAPYNSPPLARFARSSRQFAADFRTVAQSPGPFEPLANRNALPSAWLLLIVAPWWPAAAARARAFRGSSIRARPYINSARPRSSIPSRPPRSAPDTAARPLAYIRPASETERSQNEDAIRRALRPALPAGDV